MVCQSTADVRSINRSSPLRHILSRFDRSELFLKGHLGFSQSCDLLIQSRSFSAQTCHGSGEIFQLAGMSLSLGTPLFLEELDLLTAAPILLDQGSILLLGFCDLPLEMLYRAL